MSTVRWTISARSILAVALDELLVILACYPGTVHETSIEFAFAPEEDPEVVPAFVGAQWINPHGS